MVVRVFSVADAGFGVRFSAEVTVTIRLAGVDTPETFGVKRDSEEATRGRAATAAAKEWFDAHPSFCIDTSEGRGKYGRWIARVFDGDDDLGESLVAGGFAVRL